MEIDPTGLYDLIDDLKCKPLDFSLNDTKILTEALRANQLPDTIIRETALQILDLSEKGIFRSGAADGGFGWLNKYSRGKRQDRFWDRIQNDFRKVEGNIVAVAEGDSWFEHPFLHDIIDHINREKNIAVFSLAYAGDWLDNILFQGEYVDMLSVIKPDVFLVSGGGNDLLGDKKIGIMCRGIDSHQQEKNVQDYPKYVYTETIPARFADGLLELEKAGRTQEATDIRAGVKHLTKEYFGFLNIMQWQYDYLFYSLRQKYEQMPIFTQSYDYAIPQALIKRPLSLAYWYQRPLNSILNSGKWIETAMRSAKIYEPVVMHQVIKAMLFMFKQMVIETGASYAYVYHIDSQGIARPNEWFDEIHIKSHKFLQIGRTYAHAMREALALKRDNMDNQTKTPNQRVVYKSIDTKTVPTFGEAFSAFWREHRFSPKRACFQVSLLGFIFGLLFLLSEPLSLPDIRWSAPPEERPSVGAIWFALPFAYKLALFVIAGIVFGLTYRLGRAITLSYRYSRKPR